MYQIAVFIHLLAAIVWVGGTLFLVMVLVPLTRSGTLGPPNVAAPLLGHVARRFRTIGWASIAVLVITGLFLMFDRGITLSQLLAEGSGFIEKLRTKIGFVFIVLVLSAFHDFVLGPRVSRLMEELRAPGPPPANVAKLRRSLVMIARVNLLLILIIIALAVSLTRGSPF